MSQFDDIYASLDNLSQSERDELSIIEDPIRWAEVSLKNPRSPDKPFRWRKYQKEMVGHQPKWKTDQDGNKFFDGRFKVYRCGRRSGKTASMSAEAIWHAFTKPDFKVSIVAPYESQVREVFRTMAAMTKDSFVVPARVVQKPYLWEFSNGSSITGYTAGATSSTKGTGIRGSEADLIILDECDFGIDDIIDQVIMPIFNVNKQCILIMSSTPSGRHGIFWDVCNNPERWGAKHFHIPSTMIPGWDARSEDLAKRSARTTTKYQHEYLAEFGALEEGVFMNKHIMECLKEYRYEHLAYDERCEYFMGVDWNEIFGVAISIVEKRKGAPKARLWRKVKIERSEYTQPEAVDAIIEWSEKIPFKAIYVDAGFGGAQLQWIKRYGVETIGSNINKIIRPIDFGGIIEIRDPETNQMIKKAAKPFLVDNAVYFVENHLIDIPKAEDEKNMLVAAMRGYKVKKISSKTNEPTYECEEPDHELDALFLALCGITIETTAINKPRKHARPKQTIAPFEPHFNTREFDNDDEEGTARKARQLVARALPEFDHEYAEVASRRSDGIKDVRRRGKFGRIPSRTKIFTDRNSFEL